MFELFFSPEAWISLLTLTALEIILGIDNLVFISIVIHRLPRVQQRSARNLVYCLPVYHAYFYWQRLLR